MKRRPQVANSPPVENVGLATQGRLIRLARCEEEWYEDLQDPEAKIGKLRSSKRRPDIFTFWQRLPQTVPRYSYYAEKDSIAAIPIQSYEFWYEQQIDTNARRAIKTAVKKGVTVRRADFDDEFVRGMTEIFNETPIRQGKPFWHYGKDFETIKREFARYLFREEIFGAYFSGQLIGFMFLANAGGYALTSQLLSKIEHRDKAPNNILLAKAVEDCARKGVPFLVYYYWGDGTLTEFKRRNGFERVELPRYYVPLTMKGKLALKLNLHHGASGLIPHRARSFLKELRKRFYERVAVRGDSRKHPS